LDQINNGFGMFPNLVAEFVGVVAIPGAEEIDKNDMMLVQNWVSNHVRKLE